MGKILIKTAAAAGRFGFFVCLLFTLAGGLMAENSDKSIILIKNGEPKAKIYISWSPDKTAGKRWGAAKDRKKHYLNMCRSQMLKDLNYHLKKMSGADLQVLVTDDPAKVVSPAVVLGELAVKMGAKPTTTTETKESFRLICKKGMVLIGGESDIGVMYGVYELLEKLGCDWVMPGKAGEVIPKTKTVRVPFMDENQKPDFEVRCPWYTRTKVTKKELEEFDLWKMRKKNQPTKLHNGGIHPLQMIGGHIWGSLIRRYKKEFEKNPELLALVRQPDGTLKRQGPQVETTNSKTLDLFVRYIEETFQKNNWPKTKKVCLGVGPADGMGYSQSPESISAGSGRFDPINGLPDMTDLQILLCNQLLERLSDKYPNLYLGFYLYSVHSDYPMRYKPHPHVMIVIADISYSRFHATSDKNSKSRTYYRGILKQWRRLHKEQGNLIMFRGYNWNLAENLLPYTKLKIWGEDLPYYKKMGCFGSYVQWFKNWSNTGPSDYLEAEMNWNTKLKWKDVLKRYCRNAFGKGAPFMEKYYLKLVERQHGAGQEAGSYHAFHLIYDDKFIEESNKLFELALNAAETDRSKRFIRWYRAPLEFLKLYLDYRKSFTAFDFKKADQGYSKLLKVWRKYYDENSTLVDTAGPGYLGRFQKQFIKQGLLYSTGEYSIVYKLPDKLKTMLDPYVKGQEMGFQNPQLNDEYLMRTATWSIPWDAQGLAGYRDGAVWYRVPLKIPASLKGKPIGLFIGGVDDLVRVWLNGKYIGMGRGFSLPFLFDLTDDVRYGGRNLLAIQVQRYSKCSEIGLGGIVYPSFVFTGPRLKDKAPLRKPLRRILPGGALGEYEDD